MSNQVPEADFREVQAYLQALANQLSTRKACVALGMSPKSYGSLMAIYADYEIMIPVRTNQHTERSYNFNQENEDDEIKFEEETEYNADTGGYKSTKLIEMSLAQMKDPRYLLEAHGFDPAAWKLKGAKHKRWNVYSKNTKVLYWCEPCQKHVDNPTCTKCNTTAVKQVISNGHDISTLYSSAISVEPLKGEFNIDEIIEVCSSVKPLQNIWTLKEAGDASGLLEVSYHDMHWGISNMDWYHENMERSVAVINRKTYREIVFTIGSDLFHNDNFKGQTSNGTQIEAIEFPAAWKDATDFFVTLLALALQKALRVKVIFVKGNHDESMTWAFCHMLQAMFPQIEFDLEIEERKVHVFGDVAIGFTHGDKGGTNLDRSFMAQFPEFAAAKIKEIHTGHYHHEMAKDQFGVLIRTLATAGKTDRWTKDKGFVGTVKRFMIFEYSEDALDSITYV